MDVKTPPGGMPAKSILAALPTGVAIVTARDRELSVGVTVNSLTSVSLDPPTLLISLSSNLHTLSVIRATGCFGVNVLASHQAFLAAHFAQSRERKFLDVEHDHSHNMIPVIREVSGYAICDVEFETRAYDHVLVIGRMVDGHRDSRKPLVYHDRTFGEMISQ